MVAGTEEEIGMRWATLGAAGAAVNNVEMLLRNILEQSGKNR